MKAVQRWEKAFLSHMNCVCCRTTEDLQLSERYLTINEYHEHLDDIETRCTSCMKYPMSMITKRKSRSEARRDFKNEQMRMADLDLAMDKGGRNDLHLVDGEETTRMKLLKNAQIGTCAVCGGNNDLELRSFNQSKKGTLIGTFVLHTAYTIEEAQHLLDASVLVCQECREKIRNDELPRPQGKVPLRLGLETNF